MRERIIVLGASGSIGEQCLDILRFDPDYELVGVSLRSRYQELEPYLLYFDSLKYVAISDEKAAREFHALHPAYEVISGEDASTRLVRIARSSVFNAIAGNAGLRPTLEALTLDHDLFLSNKESLVIGSSLIEEKMRTSHSHIYPVDSEHASLAKLLTHLDEIGVSRERISSLIITASGGSLRDKRSEELDDVRPEEVLNHPTWHMGSKITIDSATMVNKGYEVIEASTLFHFPLEKISAVICRESLVHALIRYHDEEGEKTIFEYAPCDMKVSIAYALSKGHLGMHRLNSEDERNVERLHFAPIDTDLYPCFPLTIRMYERYGNPGMILYNAVDTCAIDAFLRGYIRFTDIHKALSYVYEHLSSEEKLTEENIDSLIDEAERYALDLISHIQEI